MSNKKQNSIEWLVQELNRNIDFIIPNVHHWDKIRDIIQQAKAMHKEEIEEAWYNSLTKADYLSGYEYYNETFGGQDNE